MYCSSTQREFMDLNAFIGKLEEQRLNIQNTKLKGEQQNKPKKIE